MVAFQSLLLMVMGTTVLSLTEVQLISNSNTNGQICEADCDNDDQCAGDLVCWQRDEGDDVPPQCVVPDGYSSTLQGYDICYDANWVEPTSEPTSVPTNEPTEFHCDIHGCPDHMVCDQNSGECVRNCDVFAIDEYMTDCSAVPNTVATMQASIASNEAKIARIEAALDQMLVSIDQVSSARSPLSNVDETAVMGNASVNMLTLTGKDLLMVVLLIVNVFMMIAMATMCFRGTHSSNPIKYRAVSIDTE